MSLSQDRPSNPAQRFLKVKSGSVQYYDKESQENVKVPTPVEFIVLDQLATVKGWSDQDESGYWSNEVRNVGSDVLNVRTSKGPKDSGIWREIKGNSSIAGAKYSASIYVAIKGRDGMEISNLALTGAALNAWIEFTQKHSVNTNKVTLSGWDDAKKGSVEYQVPVFEATPMGDDEREEAVELDKELQTYFNEYFDYTPTEDTHSAVDETDTEEDDKPVDLSDIPF